MKPTKMKSKIVLFMLIVLATACSKVPAGYVGVKVNLYGTSKGVQAEELAVGRYWIGMNEELYTFPTFTQNYVWTRSSTEGSPNDESISFQTNEGVVVNTDVGISYHINSKKVTDIFQKYRKGIDEITDIFIRNEVRDAMIKVASGNTVESMYGLGKNDFITNVDSTVKAQLQPIGIEIEKVYLVGELRLPENIVVALNAKIEATQRAMQRENELKETEAQAKMDIAKAHGVAEAQRLTQQSLTPELLRKLWIEKWDGHLPNYMTGNEASFLIGNK